MSINQRTHTPSQELGFGTKLNNRARLINPDGSFHVRRIGSGIGSFHPYHWLVRCSWWQFFAVVLLFYFFANLLFAGVFYMVGVENLTIPPHDPSMTAFWHAFFFSVQTFTTVGYGHVAPVSFLANIVAGFVALTGLMCAALMSGLFFARFSRPTASVAFSKNALVAPYRDGEAVMFRIANRRERSELINLKILVTASYLMPLEDGTSKRQFIQLPLERDEVMMFPTNWTLVHPLNEDSPFFGNTHDDLRDMDWELMVSLSAFDDTFAQTIYTRNSYKWDEVVFNARFDPMFYIDEEGMVILDLSKIDAHTVVAS